MPVSTVLSPSLPPLSHDIGPLLLRIRNGDTSGNAELYDQLASRLFIVAHRFSKNRESAEDLLACLFQRLWEKILVTPNEEISGEALAAWTVRLLFRLRREPVSTEPG